MNPATGWHDAFAWTPVTCSCGTVVWLEPYRFYLNQYGVIATILKAN
jgi:hypothetical protein